MIALLSVERMVLLDTNLTKVPQPRSFLLGIGEAAVSDGLRSQRRFSKKLGRSGRKKEAQRKPALQELTVRTGEEVNRRVADNWLVNA
jgi:hypothetical protein